MSKTEYSFDERRALEVLPVLIKSYTEKTDIFSTGKVFLPDERMPKEVELGSRDHALLLFTYAPLTARTASNALWDNLVRFYIQNPGFLDNFNEMQLIKALGAGAIGSGYFNKHVPGIIRRRNVLMERYAADPRQIFAVHKEPREAIDALSEEMYGYAYKTASLFTLYGQKYGFAKFEHPEMVLPAIDVHKIRILEMTGILKYDAKTPTLLRDVLTKEFAIKFADLCVENVLDVMLLDEALWIIGSQLCAKDEITHCHGVCPLDELCAKVFTRDHMGKYFKPDKIKNCGQLRLFKKPK